MDNILEFSGEVRTSKGKSSAKFYRDNKKILGVIYGQGKETMPVTIEEHKFNIVFDKINIKSRLIKLNIDGRIIDATIADIQKHPVTDKVEHIDFVYVDSDKPSKMLVNLKYVNLEKSPGFKKGGKINIILRDIYLLCSAENAPKYLEVDLAKLNIGDKIRENDLSLPGNSRLYSKTNRTIVNLRGRNKKEDPATPGSDANSGK